LNLGFGSNGFWRENEEEDLSVKIEEAIIDQKHRTTTTTLCLLSGLSIFYYFCLINGFKSFSFFLSLVSFVFICKIVVI
jgi:hypothetical protein